MIDTDNSIAYKNILDKYFPNAIKGEGTSTYASFGVPYCSEVVIYAEMTASILNLDHSIGNIVGNFDAVNVDLEKFEDILKAIKEYSARVKPQEYYVTYKVGNEIKTIKLRKEGLKRFIDANGDFISVTKAEF